MAPDPAPNHTNRKGKNRKTRGRRLKFLKQLPKRKQFKLKVAFQMCGGVVSGKGGLNYPFARVIQITTHEVFESYFDLFRKTL